MRLCKSGMQLALAVALVAMLGQAGYCQSVSITSPADGSVVRGEVVVQGVKATADAGWIAFKIARVNESGAYVEAVTAPFEFRWDTQARNERGQRLYPDGEYRITATGYNAAGQPQGEASIRVTVNNDISPAMMGRAVNLRALYVRGERVRYALVGETDVQLSEKAAEAIKQLSMPAGGGMVQGAAGPMGGPMMGPQGVGGPPGGPGMGPAGPGPGMMPGGPGMPGGPPGGPGMMPGGPGMVPGPAMMPGAPRPGAGAGVGAPTGGARQAGAVKELPTSLQLVAEAKWEEECLTPTATGRAVIDKRVADGWYELVVKDGPGPKRLDGVGKIFRVKVLPNNVIKPMHDDSERFVFGELYVELPDRDLQVGDTWEGEMTYCSYLEQQDAPVKIKATHKLDGFEYKGIHPCARIVSTFSKDEDLGEWHLADFPVNGKSKLEGKRISYFALDEGRFVAMEDTLKREVEIQPQDLAALLAGAVGGTSQQGMGARVGMAPGAAFGGPGPAGQGMPMMPGPGMMPGGPAGAGPGMMPGPGMPPGAPGMGPGGPAAPMPGMMPGPGMAPMGPGMRPGGAPGVPGAPAAGMQGRAGAGMTQTTVEPVKVSVVTRITIKEIEASGGPSQVARW